MAKLTNKLIDSLKASNQNYIVWDDKVKRLRIRISNLTKKFVLNYCIAHERKAIVKKLVLGMYNVLKTEEAGRRKKNSKGMVVNFFTGKRSLRNKITSKTIKEFCDLYIERHARIKKK